jgi:hypothetical protein
MTNDSLLVIDISPDYVPGTGRKLYNGPQQYLYIVPSLFSIRGLVSHWILTQPAHQCAHFLSRLLQLRLYEQYRSRPLKELGSPPSLPYFFFVFFGICILF